MNFSVIECTFKNITLCSNFYVLDWYGMYPSIMAPVERPNEINITLFSYGMLDI